jgi:hypothetical protein
MRRKLIIGLAFAAVPLLVFGVFLLDSAMAYNPPLQTGMTPAQVDQVMGVTPTGCAEPRSSGRCYYRRTSVLGTNRRIIVDFRGGGLSNWQWEDEQTTVRPSWTDKMIKLLGL